MENTEKELIGLAQLWWNGLSQSERSGYRNANTRPLEPEEVLDLYRSDSKMYNYQTIKNWIPPLRDTKEINYDGVHVYKVRHEAGTFLSGGSYGAKYVEIKNSFIETCLDIDGVTWMSDAPHNALTIEQDMKMLKPGSVVLGGLGLGIHLHYLLAMKHITNIYVVEKENRIVDSIYWEGDPRVQVIIGDFYDACKYSKMKYDNYHWDCFKGGSSYDEALLAYIELVDLRCFNNSKSNLIFHGAPSLNILNY